MATFRSQLLKPQTVLSQQASLKRLQLAHLLSHRTMLRTQVTDLETAIVSRPTLSPFNRPTPIAIQTLFASYVDHQQLQSKLNETRDELKTVQNEIDREQCEYHGLRAQTDALTKLMELERVEVRRQRLQTDEAALQDSALISHAANSREDRRK